MEGLIIENGVLTKYTGYGGHVAIPEGVTAIGRGAFEACSDLESVDLPESLVKIGATAFRFCEGLTDINIPRGVNVIGIGAFDYCRGLTDITLPDSVVEIQNSAFRHCEGLEEISIPQSVAEIGRDAFAGTAWLENRRREDPFVVVNGILIDAKTCRGDVKIPEGVVRIVGCAFAGNRDITGVTFPESVKGFGWKLFMNCTALKSVTLSKGITKITYGAFINCASLESVTVPDSVSCIEFNVFRRTPWLENKRRECPLVVVNGILIDAKTCRGDVKVPEGVTTIGTYAFRRCSDITGITLPQSVVRLEWGAFSECGLTEITVPDSVIYIGDDAFSDIENISVSYRGKIYTKDDIAELYANGGSF